MSERPLLTLKDMRSGMRDSFPNRSKEGADSDFVKTQTKLNNFEQIRFADHNPNNMCQTLPKRSIMQDFSYRSKSVEFWQVTGKVLATDKYHETHISGSGGGGYIGQYGGRINPISIDSSTVINHEFWIKTKYGVEKDIKLYNINIPLRSGQKITLISAARKGADTGLYTILVNHSAGKHWFINSAQDLNKKLQLEQFTGKSLIIAGMITWGLSFLITDHPQVARDSILYIKNLTGIFDGIHWEDLAKTIILGIPSAFVIYRLLVKLSRVSELTNKLDNHLEKLAQFAYINY